MTLDKNIQNNSRRPQQTPHYFGNQPPAGTPVIANGDWITRSEFNASTSRIDASINRMDGELRRLSLGFAKMETKMDSQQKSLDKITEKVDAFTWKLGISIALLILGNFGIIGFFKVWGG